jgi:hypothetical protein
MNRMSSFFAKALQFVIREAIMVSTYCDSVSFRALSVDQSVLLNLDPFLPGSYRCIK